MEEKLKKVKEILEKENQEQLLVNYDSLNDNQKEILLDQILEINFKQMKELYNSVNNIKGTKNTKIEAIPYIEKDKITDKKYFEKGAEILKSGKVAVVTMAGGQGTRLRT